MLADSDLPFLLAGLTGAFLAYLLARFATAPLRGLLLRHDIVARINERSLHDEPKAVGGGLVIIVAVALVWTIGAAFGLLPWAGLPGFLALAAISFLDDMVEVSVRLRFTLQVVAVAVGMALLFGKAPIFQGLLPFWADRLAAGFLWLWFINLFNFMDGIDGIATIETASIAAGIAAVALLTQGGPGGELVLALTLAGGALGFLAWNWPPARIFLGDVGSVPIGYLLGLLLFWLAADGYWLAAIILPLYFTADASITLMRRLLRGERIWRAHRSHFYQRAARALAAHAPVTRSVGLLNLLLIACAVLSVWQPAWAPVSALIALVATAGLLWRFARLSAGGD